MDTVATLRYKLAALLPQGFDPDVDRLSLVVDSGTFVFRRIGWVTARPCGRQPHSAGGTTPHRGRGRRQREHTPSSVHVNGVVLDDEANEVDQRQQCEANSSTTVRRFDEDSTPLSAFGLPSIRDPDGHPCWGWGHDFDTSAVLVSQPAFGGELNGFVYQPRLSVRRSTFPPHRMLSLPFASGPMISSSPSHHLSEVRTETTLPSDLGLLPLPRIEVQYM